MNVVSFLERFVRPFVTGGEVHIGQPIPPGVLDEWALDITMAGEALGAIDDARENLAAELVVRPPRMIFGADELRLAAALHDTLCLAHPSLDRWLVAGARARIREAAALLAGSVGPPEGRDAWIGRHALLANLFQIRRVDIKLTWWAGSAQFQGMRPPSRLTSWRAVRRVREQSDTLTVADFLSDEGAAPAFAALLDASPLTDVLQPARAWPAFSWVGRAELLRDAEIARAVAYRWLADPRSIIAGTTAWEKLLSQPAPAADVRAVTAFLVHVAALRCAAEVQAKDPPAAPPEELRPFAIVPLVAAAADPALGTPPGFEDDRALLARWRLRAGQAAELPDQPRRALLTERLQQALARS